MKNLRIREAIRYVRFGKIPRKLLVPINTVRGKPTFPWGGLTRNRIGGPIIPRGRPIYEARSIL